jgi:hypothetical protein
MRQCAGAHRCAPTINRSGEKDAGAILSHTAAGRPNPVREAARRGIRGSIKYRPMCARSHRKRTRSRWPSQTICALWRVTHMVALTIDPSKASF